MSKKNICFYAALHLGAVIGLWTVTIIFFSCRIFASYNNVSRIESFVIVDTHLEGTIPTTLGSLASIGTFLGTLSNYVILVFNLDLRRSPLATSELSDVNHSDGAFQALDNR